LETNQRRYHDVKISEQSVAAEFDSFAEHYERQVMPPLKRLVGGDGEPFIAAKVRWLLREMAHSPVTHARYPRLLDYGTGTGLFLRQLRGFGFEGALAGCDVSSAMLSQAKASWMDLQTRPQFVIITKDRVPFGDGTFDIIVVCCVLHHIPISTRAIVFAELRRLLAAGGQCVIFEHNPYNPATRWMVSRSPIDQNATLLNANEVAGSLKGAGFSLIKRTYMMFVPPRLRGASAIDAWLSWLPLGGQFAVVGEKPAPT
jgi:SAM-dependent methyltransferase